MRKKRPPRLFSCIPRLQPSQYAPKQAAPALGSAIAARQAEVCPEHASFSPLNRLAAAALLPPKEPVFEPVQRLLVPRPVAPFWRFLLLFFIIILILVLLFPIKIRKKRKKSVKVTDKISFFYKKGLQNPKRCGIIARVMDTV